MSWVFTASGGIYQWDPARAGPKKTFSLNNEDIISSAMSPDGMNVALTSKTAINIFSITDGLRRELAVQNARLVSYSRNCKLLYYTIQKSPQLEVIETYNLQTSGIVNKTNPHSSEIVSFSVAAKGQYILSTSLGDNPDLVLYNTSQSKTSQLDINKLFQFVLFHPKRPHFLAITPTGQVFGYSVTSSRPTNKFDVMASTATWMDDTTALAACDDGYIRYLNFETKCITSEFACSFLAKNILVDVARGDIIVGLKDGRCELFESDGPDRGKAPRRGNISVNEEDHITALGYTTCKVRSDSQILSKPVQSLSAKDLKPPTGPILDVFSPLKRKEVDSDTNPPVERNEKRIKESTSNLAKSTTTTNKRISTALVDVTKPKPPNIRDEMRSKERQMDKDAMKSLTSKFKLDKSQIDGDIFREGYVRKPIEPGNRVVKSALQVSTRHNVNAEKVNSPRKSILKTTSPVADSDVGKDTVSADKVKSSRKSILKENNGGMGTQTTSSHSPRTQKTVHDGETSSLEDVPDLDMASPVPPFRRKSPDKPTANPPPHSHSTTQAPRSSKERNDNNNNADLWTTIPDPSRPGTVLATMTTSLFPRIAPKVPPMTVPTPPLSADTGSAVLEIQTVLRRDIERLRIDILRQFVSFRGEMGQMWEGEMGRLRRENELLRGEVESLKKEAGKKNDRSVWKLL